MGVNESQLKELLWRAFLEPVKVHEQEHLGYLMFLVLPVTAQSWMGTFNVKRLGNCHDIALSDSASVTLSGYLFSTPW